MIVLGIETSCDETGVAIYDSDQGLLADALHSQIDLHRVYGGVVPELASRDHLKRVLPLINDVLETASLRKSDLHGIAYTAGPGLAGALLRSLAAAALRVVESGPVSSDGLLKQAQADNRDVNQTSYMRALDTSS